jgi:hypothetical protein
MAGGAGMMNMETKAEGTRVNNCPLCNVDPATGSSESNSPAQRQETDAAAKGLVRRIWQSVQWLFPSAVLVFIPKCPMCVAAYIALFTGIGISASTARWIQSAMLIFCLSSLACLVVRRLSSKVRAQRS